MPTFENPAVDANEAQAALRGLAHATRSISDPREIYSMLGSLSAAVASLSQSLHQLAAFHDGTAKGVWAADDTPAGRAATCEVSWELHRAGEILRQVGESIETAHGAESRVTYVHRDFPTGRIETPGRSNGHGLSL